MTLRKKIFIPLIVSFLLIISSSVFAGDPPPIGGDPTGTLEGGTPIGGSAPIGDGYLLLIGIVLLYTLYRYYQITKKMIIKI